MTVPTKGLIGEWLLESNANDTSGKGQNGSSTSVSYTTVDNMTGAYFNGSSSRIAFNCTQLNNIKSISYWAHRLNDSSGSVMSLGCTSRYYASFELFIHQRFYFMGASGGVPLAPLGEATYDILPNNKWELVTVLIDWSNISKCKVYYGTRKLSLTIGTGSDDRATSFSSSSLFGSVWNGSTTYRQFMQGYLRHIRFYDRYLSNKEIKALYLDK